MLEQRFVERFYRGGIREIDGAVIILIDGDEPGKVVMAFDELRKIVPGAVPVPGMQFVLLLMRMLCFLRHSVVVPAVRRLWNNNVTIQCIKFLNRNTTPPCLTFSPAGGAAEDPHRQRHDGPYGSENAVNGETDDAERKTDHPHHRIQDECSQRERPAQYKKNAPQEKFQHVVFLCPDQRGRDCMTPLPMPGS
jgi:hypothetical protein